MQAEYLNLSVSRQDANRPSSQPGAGYKYQALREYSAELMHPNIESISQGTEMEDQRTNSIEQNKRPEPTNTAVSQGG
jgi:hypothetical protein